MLSLLQKYCPYTALKDKGIFLSLLCFLYGEIDEKKDVFWCLELINQFIHQDGDSKWREMDFVLNRSGFLAA